MLTPDELTAIEQRAEAATPGPWTSEYESWAGDNAVLSTTFNGHAVAVCGEEVPPGYEYPASKDAAFIAAARTDVPRLVAEVRFIHGQLVNQMKANIELTAERDRARRWAVHLEQEHAEKAVAIARVRQLHAGFGIYADCGHDHQNGEPGVKDLPVVGLVCADGHRYTICRTCCTENGGDQTEECASRHRPHYCYPCPTINALDSAGPADAWIVPKIPHDPDAAVGPTIRPGGRITRAAGDDNPDTLRAYAAKCLAAADAAEQQNGGDRG